MSQYNIGSVNQSVVGDNGVLFVGGASALPQDVIAAFDALRRSLGPSPSDETEREFVALARELKAKQPSRKNILSRIRAVTAAAGAVGAIGSAAEALSTAVHAWL